MGEQKQTPSEDSSDEDSDLDRKPRAKRNQSSLHQASTEGYHGDQSDDDSEHSSRKIRHKRRRRLDAHSRDGRWYPSHDSAKSDDDKIDAEEEKWDHLKDVVSTDSSYRHDEDKSITSRLRSSTKNDI